VLAEHLTVRELVADPEFARGALHDLPEDRARHALTVLGYAAQHDQRAGALILDAVKADPKRMILPAVAAAVETSVSLDAWLADQLHVASMDLLQLAELSAAMPLESQSLSRAATVVRRRLIKEATDELNRISNAAADRTESERRQTELVEIARVHRSLQEQGDSLPVPVRNRLLKALEYQRKDLVFWGSPSEAESISREIAWIKAHKPKPHDAPRRAPS
jgi:hypothetical protein